jgi:hypothetical protein
MQPIRHEQTRRIIGEESRRFRVVFKATGFDRDLKSAAIGCLSRGAFSLCADTY